MKYNLAQRVFLVKKKGLRIEGNILSLTSFKNRNLKTCHSVIKNILSKFEKNGSVVYVYPKKSNSGKKLQMSKNQLNNLVSKFPQLSIR